MLTRVRSSSTLSEFYRNEDPPARSSCPNLPSVLLRRQAYDNCVVLEARICYNVAKLMALSAER